MMNVRRIDGIDRLAALSNVARHDVANVEAILDRDAMILAVDRVLICDLKWIRKRCFCSA
jgi:hypothetical protein